MEGIVFSFTGITTQLKNGIEKKELHDLPFGWKDLTQSSINPSHKGFGRLTGKVAGITVFDFDNIESFDKFWDDHPTLNIYDYKMVQTRKGFHVYFEYDADCKQGTNVSNKYEGVDIRNDGGFVICPPSHYTCLDGSVFTYKNSCGKILPVPNEFKSILKGNEVKTINKTISKCSDDIIVELSSIIDIKFIDNYSDWIKLVWAFSNEEKYYDLAKQVSQRSSKYEDKCFDDLWKSSKKKITLGTIYYYAKKSNPEEYMNIIIKYSTNQIEEILKNPTQENMARCFYKLCGDDFIYTDGQVFYFNGVVWVKSKNDLRRKYTNEFTNVFRKREEYYSAQLRQFDSESDEYKRYSEKKKNIHSLINQLEKNQNTKDICNDAIIPYIEKNDVVFETNPYMFCFNNKVFDLEKCEFVAPFKYDYMCISTGYDYTEPTQEQIERLNDIIIKIFPIAEERKLYLTLLSTGLFGTTLEHFILANGSGRNGKGLTNELAEAMFGNYAYTCSNSILLNSLEKSTGANQAIANMNNKRMIFYREPDESINVKLNSSIIKELTGGSEINARALYSSNTKTSLRATHILECNKKPKMSGEANEATISRVIDIPFHCSFTAKNDDEVDEENHIYKPDTYFKESSFRTDHRIAMFHLLVAHWKEYKKDKCINDFIPESIRVRGYKYLQESDELLTWFNEEYEKVDDDTEVIQLKDVFEDFKNSDYYVNLNKAEKRECNKSKFIDKISKNYFMRKFYRERDRRPILQERYKCIEMRNVLIGYKKKEIYE